MKSFGLIILLITLITSIGVTTPRFKVNDCLENKVTDNIRKITAIKPYVYKFCIYNKIEKKCSGNFYLRREFIDRNMKKINCPLYK